MTMKNPAGPAKRSFAIMLLLVLGTACAGPTSKPLDDATAVTASGTTSQVKAAFVAGMTAAQEIGSPPADYIRKAREGMKKGTSVGVVSPSVRQKLRSDGITRAEKLFTNAAMPSVTRGLDGQLDEDSDKNTVNLGAGVRKVSFTRVESTGDSARVVADVTAWAESYVKFDKKGKWVHTNPVSVMHFEARLVYASGTWKISSYRGSFAPGNEPVG